MISPAEGLTLHSTPSNEFSIRSIFDEEAAAPFRGKEIEPKFPLLLFPHYQPF
jgi:hypothetical protein